IGAGLSAAPTLARISGNATAPSAAQKGASHAPEDTQAHSGEFRKRTWMGTVRMAVRNPWLGTGIGTFAVAYPRYSDIAFTAHAPLATQTPRRAGREIWIVGAVICLFLIGRALQTGASRWQRSLIERSQSGLEAIAAARAAAAADPFDPEPQIALGQLDGRNA